MIKSFKFWLAPTMVAALLIIFFAFKPAEEKKTYVYKQFSTVESIISGGLGRSRVLTTDEKGSVVEKDLMNFYSLVGINFGNIANNDRVIVDKINEWTGEGWELYSVTSASQTNMNNGSTSNGVYLTRYLFRKEK